MITVKVELVPHGFGTPKTIGFAEISNVTDDRRADYKTICDYVVNLSTDEGHYAKVTVERFERSRGFWSLIHQALSQIEAAKAEGKPLTSPITLDEAKTAKVNGIPHEVIESFNELITENLRGSSAKFTQKDVVARIKKKMRVASEKIFDRGWLDVEPMFEREGWRVEYDKPAYNETYEATFEFSKRR